MISTAPITTATTAYSEMVSGECPVRRDLLTVLDYKLDHMLPNEIQAFLGLDSLFLAYSPHEHQQPVLLDGYGSYGASNNDNDYDNFAYDATTAMTSPNSASGSTMPSSLTIGIKSSKRRSANSPALLRFDETLRAEARQKIRSMSVQELRKLAESCEEMKRFERLRADPVLQDMVQHTIPLLHELRFVDDMYDLWLRFDPTNCNHSALLVSCPMIPMRKQLLRRMQFMGPKELKRFRAALQELTNADIYE